VNRANLAPLIDKNQRAVKAVPAPIGGALDTPQIDGNGIPGRGGAESIEMPGFRLNSLSRVFGEDLLL
jgi:hypothetical protein